MAECIVPIGRNGVVNGFADEFGSLVKVTEVAPRGTDVAKCPKPGSRATVHNAILQVGPRAEDIVTGYAEFRKERLRISVLSPHWQTKINDARGGAEIK